MKTHTWLRILIDAIPLSTKYMQSASSPCKNTITGKYQQGQTVNFCYCLWHPELSNNQEHGMPKPYHCFRWYVTLQNKTPVEMFPVSLACYWQIGSKSTNHSPIAWRGGFRSDLSITCKTDKFWKRFRWWFVFQSCVSTKTVVSIVNLSVSISSKQK